MRQDIRQLDTGHPGLEPWGRDRRPHVPSSKTNDEKERRLPSTGILRSGQALRSVGEADKTTPRFPPRKAQNRLATAEAPYGDPARARQQLFVSPGKIFRRDVEPSADRLPYAIFHKNQPVAM